MIDLIKFFVIAPDVHLIIVNYFSVHTSVFLRFVRRGRPFLSFESIVALVLISLQITKLQSKYESTNKSVYNLKATIKGNLRSLLSYVGERPVSSK